jgi:hypothetical protein
MPSAPHLLWPTLIVGQFLLDSLLAHLQRPDEPPALDLSERVLRRYACRRVIGRNGSKGRPLLVSL